jgi:O-antigen/teichoic acid export membrane protein
MSKSLKYSNLLLRGMSILSKFLLILYITKYFSISELGMYSLFFTSITLFVLVLGFDFYMYNTREILALNKNSLQSKYIVNQLFVHLVFYIILLPMALILFQLNVLPSSYLLWFYVIVITEHLSQELYRLLITLSYPVYANFLYFVRTSSWIYIILLLWYFDVNKEYHNLETVWEFWFFGSFISVILGVAKLIKIINFTDSFSLKTIEIEWIKKGLRISVIFFVMTIMLKIIEFSDRYMIQYFLNNEQVGIYSFYSNFANVAQVIIFTLVVMIDSPKFLEAIAKKNVLKYKKLKKTFNNKVFYISVVSFFIVSITIYIALYFVNKISLFNNISTFFILNVSTFIQNILLITYYHLYAYKKENILLFSTIFAALLNIILNIIFIQYYGIFGAAIATLISISIMLIVQYIFIRKISNV